jgi:hypothetical protein
MILLSPNSRPQLRRSTRSASSRTASPPVWRARRRQARRPGAVVDVESSTIDEGDEDAELDVNDVDPEAREAGFDEIYRVDETMPSDVRDQLTARGYGPPVRSRAPATSQSLSSSIVLMPLPTFLYPQPDGSPPAFERASELSRRRSSRRASASRSTR